MKKVVNLVVTGGPCGGKTTALEALSNFFRSEGYTVYIVNEAATELINSGICPFGENKLDPFDFQRMILKKQLSDEEIRRWVAQKCDNEKVAIIYDRGLMDNRAFITEEQFQQLLKEFNITEAEILSRYDIVIHLVTAAIGKEEYYTTLNNKARTETIQQARENDNRIMNAWKNHTIQVIIPNDTLFNEKIQRVKNAIRKFLGEEEVVAQRRFLVSEEDIDIEKLQALSIVKENIEEFVKQYDNIEDEVFCRNIIEGSCFYTRVVNHFMPDGTVVKSSKNISEEEYYNSKIVAKSIPISKERYNLIFEGERFRVDIFSLGEKRVIILERDVVNKDKEIFPDFVKTATEVTCNRDYNEDSMCIDYSIETRLKSLHSYIDSLM